jgi:hypothetical protein
MNKDISELLAENFRLEAQLDKIRIEYMANRKAVAKQMATAYKNQRKIILHRIKENKSMVIANATNILFNKDASRDICVDWRYRVGAEMMEISDEAQEGHDKRMDERSK